jgi:hypothetical protein
VHALAVALRALAQGRPTAAALLAIDRTLGHDQEARVLRLQTMPAEQAAAAAAGLRRTAKAAALRELAGQPEDGPARRAAAAAAFVDAMHGIERDNAQRREQGTALWLPLPASPEVGLRDARMFLVQPDAEDAAQASDGGAFTVVLLLDLTRLGELRVDLELRGSSVRATLQALRPLATGILTRDLDELRADLERSGLQVDRLLVRQAPERGLPVADLVGPSRGGGSVVDVHA